MKKIYTLGFGIVFSMAAFAAAPSRLTINAARQTGIKVVIDENRFIQESADNNIVFENLQPGMHDLKIYQLTEDHGGRFFRERPAAYRLVYASNVNIRPLFATTVVINRYGAAQVNEQPLRLYNDSRNQAYDRADDHRFHDNERRDDGNHYRNDNGHYTAYDGGLISETDFFAAERVLDRENDNGRLLYARRLADENYMTSEQVKELARFFSFDNNRFEFVQYAYAKTTDKNNFITVCSAFSSAEGRGQVLRFLKSCP